LLILGTVDLDTFERDGYVVVRGAVSAKVAEACRQGIWAAMGQRGIRPSDPATWPTVVEIDSLTGEAFAEAGASPALTAACDALIGPQRWTSPIRPGAAVVVRFPSQDRANAGYHIEGSYDGRSRRQPDRVGGDGGADRAWLKARARDNEHLGSAHDERQKRSQQPTDRPRGGVRGDRWHVRVAMHVQDGGSLAAQRLLPGGADLVGFVHQHTLEAQAGGEAGVVDVR
jgi:hypothetical protein